MDPGILWAEEYWHWYHGFHEVDPQVWEGWVDDRVWSGLTCAVRVLAEEFYKTDEGSAVELQAFFLRPFIPHFELRILLLTRILSILTVPFPHTQSARSTCGAFLTISRLEVYSFDGMWGLSASKMTSLLSYASMQLNQKIVAWSWMYLKFHGQSLIYNQACHWYNICVIHHHKL